MGGDVVEEVKAVTMASGVSTSNILRFGPIGFNADAGKYKVCFCDSALLPAGREACLPKRTTASRSASSMCLASRAYWLTPDSAVAHATKCTTVGWHAATMSSTRRSTASFRPRRACQPHGLRLRSEVCNRSHGALSAVVLGGAASRYSIVWPG